MVEPETIAEPPVPATNFAVNGLVELMPYREQVLNRVVVEALGQGFQFVEHPGHVREPVAEQDAKLEAIGHSLGGLICVVTQALYETYDAGETWRHGNAGLVPRYVPEESQGDTIDLCVHNMHRAPLRPERLFMQFHGGVYRSDDTGETWNSIAEGLPSDFGFPMVLDPSDPDSAFVIPLVAATDRVTVDGRVRVFGTRDAGKSWTALSDGLPQEDAYLTIL